MGAEEWDIFISHASEDKVEVARPLANILSTKGMKVWLDESELFVGDSLRAKIDEGLARSQFGIVILSRSFFSKHWAQAELDGLAAQEARGDKRILPVWHNLSFEEVCNHSPLLAGRLAAETKDGLRVVADRIVKATHQTMTRRADAPIFDGRITKEILMSLPEGAYLYSNCFTHDHVPVFAKELGELGTREEDWSHIVRMKLAGTKFRGFADSADYRRYWSSQMRLIPPSEIL
jgi:hypothetical protein